MFIKTVSTTSGINPIKFNETSGVFYWILNTGSSTVYASIEASFSAGDDGVVSLGPKESRRLETKNDTIYILGEGQVEIHNQRDGICSFKQAPASSGGGETVDAYTKTESDTKYASKSIYGDNGISLPAVGCAIAMGPSTIASGNQSVAFGAESTASSTHAYAYGRGCIASKIGAHAIGTYCKASDYYSFAFGEYAETSNRDEVTFGTYNLSNEDTVFSIGDGEGDDTRHNAFEITKTGGKLHDKDIATIDQIPTTTPMKSMVVSGATNGFSDLALFPISSGKVPVLMAYNDVYCTPFLSSTGSYYAHMIDAHGNNMANVTINSATVYYI